MNLKPHPSTCTFLKSYPLEEYCKECAKIGSTDCINHERRPSEVTTVLRKRQIDNWSSKASSLPSRKRPKAASFTYRISSVSPSAESESNRSEMTTITSSSSGVSHEKRSSKNTQDEKLFVEEFEKERMFFEGLEWRVPDVVEPAPTSLVNPPHNLDNWVACNTCDQWRLLMPQVDPHTLPKKWCCEMMDWL